MDRAGVFAVPAVAVVKVGTNVLADPQGHLNAERIQALANQLQMLRKRGWQVVLVSSGAIGAGMGRLGLAKRPTDLPHMQACAAVGQTALMQLYQAALQVHQYPPAQILLTAGDFAHRARYLNVRHTIHTLFEYGCLPVINENDTVSVAEIQFGDNDHLAALVANLLQASVLVLLTNVDGLYATNPSTDPTASIVSEVSAIDQRITDMVNPTRSQLGTGGMKSKLMAARLACSAGASVVIANGASEQILERIWNAEPVGTLFRPRKSATNARKRWLGYATRPAGTVQIDAGATRAILKAGKSLLPVGIRSLEGEFRKGDVLRIFSPDAIEVARGLSNYSSTDLQKVIGKTTEQLKVQMADLPYPEVIHRDQLMILAEHEPVTE